MASDRQPVLLGFEHAESISALLGHFGIPTDLGAFLSEHLLTVLRQQYTDLCIEALEFLGAGNCDADGMLASDTQIMNADRLSVPLYVSATVVARRQRCKLRLQVIIHAQMSEGGYELKSDVKVQGQTLLNML